MPEPRATQTINYATAPDVRPDVLIVRRSRRDSIIFIVFGGVALAFCERLILSKGGANLLDALWTAMGPLFIVAIGVWGLSDRAPMLVFSDASFLSRAGKPTELRWSDIADALVVHHNNRYTYLILRLVDPTEPIPETYWARRNGDLPREVADEDVILLIDGLGLTPARILAEIRGRITPPASPRHG